MPFLNTQEIGNRPSIAECLKLSDRLRELSDSPELDVQLLLGHALNKETSYLYTWPERALSIEETECFCELLARRLDGEPVAYLLGYQDFWSLRLEVSKETLIPRPDTELLVESVLSLPDMPAADVVRVADLGTGTGAIALALASEKPSWQIYASDFIQGAAELAERNAKRLKLKNVKILTGSWYEPHCGRYHLIVSNPPYIDPTDSHLSQGDVRFEPSTALVSGQFGLKDIVQIVSGAPDYLEPNGYLVLEHGYDQGSSVWQLLVDKGFANVRTLKDYSNNDRVTIGQWSL